MLAAAPLAAQDKAAKVDKVLEEQAYTLGTQAYIFGFTLNELYRSMYEIVIDPKREGKASVNEFNHIRDLATPEDEWVVTPNNDTLYSRAFLDLSGGPLVLTIPEIGDGRIFYFPMGDAYHNIFYKVTKTETGAGAAGDYALLPPGWKGLLPEGLTRVEAPTPHVWILGRTLVSPTPEDVAAVNALQDKYTISTLADWTAGKVTDFEADPADYPVYTRKDSADPMKYFDVLNEMMRRNPPFPRDLAFVEQLRRIGLHPEQDFNPETADPAIVAGLTRAVETARAMLKRRMQEIDVVNGFAAFENPSDYGIDYLNRAAAGFIGLLASDSGMTTARPGFTDMYGKPLDGSKSTYTLTFKELPPVDDFWSLTVYRKASGFLAKNPLNRYSFGDRTEGLKLGEDGSLTIQFSSDEPKEGAANWLPIPEEPFYVVLRTYYPKFAARNGTWIVPGLKPVK
jgi:hypothetical protein